MLIAEIRQDLPEIKAAKELAAQMSDYSAARDVDAAVPVEFLTALHKAGLLALTVPESLGGGGAGLELAAEVIREIGYGDPSTALIVVMQYAHHATLQRGRWSPELISLVTQGAVQRGELINALRVEPELGTPMRGGLPATIARRTEGGWRISGRKIYSTGSTALTWGVVWARTDEDDPRVGQFLVPLSAQGVEVVPSWDTLGLRASASHDVVLSDVFLPAEYAADIRRPVDWTVRADEVMAWSSLLIAALYTGVAEAARDWILQFLRTRVPANLGKPLAELPRMQEAVGAIEQRIAVNRRLIALAASQVDRGAVPPGHEIGIIKNSATENAIAAVEGALKLAGNHAIARRNPLERHYRNVLCGRIHSPQEDSVLTAAGRHVLGL